MTRKAVLAMVLGVLAASGAYSLIYLFRWEWHRAIITGIFFLAAELAFVAIALVRKLSRLEERLDQLTSERGASLDLPVSVDPGVLADLREAAPPARRHFDWLDPSRSQGANVFLPFLLGVGAVASGLAWVVEQIARRTTAPMLEQRLAFALAPLSLPAGGLVGPPPAPPVAAKRPLRRPLALIAGAVVALALVAGSIDWLADALQTRPDEARPGVTTTVEVQLRGATSATRPERSATELWGTCSHVLHSRGVDASLQHVGGGRIAIHVPADIGPHGEARLRGCLQDAVVDRVQASVVSVSH